jgi:diguanylate cyclase (GGDEF)-like protein/PAS domain S-box-containing protein
MSIRKSSGQSEEARQTFYLELSRQNDLWNSSLKSALETICEACSGEFAVARASVWLLSGTGDLICRNLFLSPSQEHQSGTLLSSIRYPSYFVELEKSRIIDACDARTDHRTRPFLESYLEPLGIGAMLDAPLRVRGQLVGVLCFEHLGGPRIWTSDEKNLACAIADLIVQVQINYELLQEHDHYRSLFEAAGDCIFVVRDGSFIDCNPATEKIFGCPREEIIGKSPVDFSPEFQPSGENSVLLAQEKIAAAMGGVAQQFSWEHTRANGHLFAAEVTLNLIDNEAEPRILGIVRDVSKSRAAEDKMKMHRDQLQASIEAMPGIYYLFSQDGKLVYCNQAYRDTFKQRGETEGIHNIVSSVYENDRDRIKASIEQVFRDGSTIKADLQVYNRDNKLIWLHATGSRVVLAGQRYLVGAAVDITDRVAAQNGLEFQAKHDNITGLPNREALYDRIRRELLAKSQQSMGLLLIDLDRFKEVNDALGHRLGDQLLCAIGPRVSSTLNISDGFFCRIGGDEFALLMTNSSAEQVRQQAERLVRIIRKPFTIDEITLDLSASIGVAMLDDTVEDERELFRRADVAVYHAKHQAAGYSLYQPEIDAHSRDKLALMAQLREAVSDDQFVLFYQPKLDIQSGKVVGVEALIRWQHPQRGLLFPDVFIDLVEVSHLIQPVTQWVIESAVLLRLRFSMRITSPNA